MSAELRYLPGFEHERRDLSRSQWYSPPELAEEVWSWACAGQRDIGAVLEPAAGKGALVRPALRDCRVSRVTAIDIDPVNVEALRALRGPRQRRLSAVCGDFLSFTPRQRFGLCVQNPPFEDGQDVAFIMHALQFAPRVVGIYRSALVHGSGRFEALWRHVDMTRLAYIVNRPKFGAGTGAQSDFIVAEFFRRDMSPPRQRGESCDVKVEWW